MEGLRLTNLHTDRTTPHHITGQRAVRFWSSSLLFVDHEEAEAAEEAAASSSDSGEEEGEAGQWHPAADMRMIDFAHVELREGGTAGGGDRGDENYMYGLRSLLAHLRRLQARAVGEGEGR